MSETFDAMHAREMAVETVADAGAYIMAHAEDFVARAESDELVLEDGFELVVHVRTVRELPTITVMREVMLPPHADGRA
ncbi:MAG: hypothetical protein SPD98_04740 [Tractidigestivibacter sp.]|uniref:hypothetical protein n=1 Tax=Tractidigestivibacter sp. TaxID=2847320 RepID=UPI002A7ED341|nr:hypothetical protein [Tractidigestivibacter sp.]MDY4534538.1 hypothetical protein [Tractidigestivibacter sp.]